MDEPPRPANFAITALLVEGGMGLVAVALGWALGYPPGDAVAWELAGWVWGAAAAVPLLALMGVCIRVPWRPFRELLGLLDEMVLPLFRNCPMADLFLVSALAGLGEEMLFRGVIQRAVAGGLEPPWNEAFALVVSGVLFGLAHYLTRTYAVLATLIGLYLGWLWLATGNLLVPIVAHGLYDFLALVYLTRFRGARACPPGGSPPGE
ncbi:MAG: CPBP family intramembrane metalloprotease [Thermoguttaceae bacterium]|jgi:membrane protease YdiL (CAAX protease family)|nr:CPBP family intramembrane metalloprotease [Thermoguttaceae bacterium]